MKKDSKTNKRIGGPERARLARQELEEIFGDPTHPLHVAKDIEFAKKYDVARHTIYKIRDEMKVPPRSKRVLNVLSNMDTSKYTLRELSSRLGLKYQNLYKVVTDENLPYKK